MRISRKTTAAPSGFTLVEMVLAIGISATVILAVSACLYSALRLRERVTQTVEESQPLEWALATMQRDLKGATPINGLMSGDFRAGNVTSLGLNQNVAIEFHTTTGVIRDTSPWGDVQRVSYQLRAPVYRTETTGKDLIRTITRNLLSTLTPVPEEQWLMGNVENLQFSCFDGSQWLDTWDTSLNNTNLPTAVRVRLMLGAKTQNGQRPTQPVEIVVPIVSQSQTNQTIVTTSTGG